MGGEEEREEEHEIEGEEGGSRLFDGKRRKFDTMSLMTQIDRRPQTRSLQLVWES